MIYYVPIEQYKERYSYWWYDYIPTKIKKRGTRCTTVHGKSLTDQVSTGTVLDAAGTNYYKATQIQAIAELFKENKIQPYDSFLVADIWFPGIESIRYMSDLYKIPVTIWGVWHAGSITEQDFAQPMNPWAKYFEMGWINMCDGIFVGSDYAKISLINKLFLPIFAEPSQEAASELINKIHPYGMPIEWERIQEIKNKNKSEPKANIILFPHRPDREKGIESYIDIIDQLSIVWDDFEDWMFVFCTSKEKYKSQSSIINSKLSCLKRNYLNIEIQENLNREEYYTLLDRSKIVVSTTKEENFGYCVVEAAAFGCNVVAPNDFSHVEIFNKDYRILYDDVDEVASKIISLAENPIPDTVMSQYVEPYQLTVEVWTEFLTGRRR